MGFGPVQWKKAGWVRRGAPGRQRSRLGLALALVGKRRPTRGAGGLELGWIYGRRGRPVRAKQGSDAVNGCGRGARLPRDRGGAILVFSTGRRVA